MNRPKRRYITNACEACRARRSKCTGSPQPCEACQKTGTLCVFNSKLDRRRKFTFSTEEQHLVLLSITRAFFNILRNATDHEVQELLAVMRKGSLDETATYILSILQKVQPQFRIDGLGIISDKDLKQFILQAFVEPNILSNVSHDCFTIKGESPSPMPEHHHESPSVESESIDQSSSMNTDDTTTKQSPFDNIEASSATSPPSISGNHSVHPIPTSLPRFIVFAGPSNFSQACMTLRDRCDRLFANNSSANENILPRHIDCELLMRDRMSHDIWDISSQACEIARRLPPMLLTTRIALALCLARAIPFLTRPCIETYSQLPGMLRPIEAQIQFPHEITAAVIPVPALRKQLAFNHKEDWFETLLKYNLRCNWNRPVSQVYDLRNDGSGSFELNTRTRWEKGSLSELLRIDDNECAIRLDPSTGRCYISEEFERHCWNYQNWTIDRGVLDVWPDLAGQIAFTQQLEFTRRESMSSWSS